MSSFSVDASGSRALTSTINDQQRTAAQVPSKMGDHVNVQLGSFEEIHIVVPTSARLERRKAKDGTSEYLVLVAPGSLAIHARAGESSWPHGWLYAGKHIEAFTDSLEVVEVVHEQMGDLIPPTE